MKRAPPVCVQTTGHLQNTRNETFDAESCPRPRLRFQFHSELAAQTIVTLLLSGGCVEKNELLSSVCNRIHFQLGAAADLRFVLFARRSRQQIAVVDSPPLRSSRRPRSDIFSAADDVNNGDGHGDDDDDDDEDKDEVASNLGV